MSSWFRGLFLKLSKIEHPTFGSGFDQSLYSRLSLRSGMKIS